MALVTRTPGDRMVPAVVGNAGAMFCGFLACFGTLALRGQFEVRGLDVFFYYCVSHLVVVGHGADIYNLQALGRVESSTAFGWSVPSGVVPNAYPPSFVLLVAPLAYVPYTVAYFVWMGVNCVLLAVALYALECIAGLRGRSAFVFRALAVLSLPILLALIHGQASILELACLALSLLAVERRRDVVAGVALAGLLTKPQYLPALVLALLLLRRWRALGAFVATCAVELLIPAPILGISSVGNWIHVLITARTWTNRPGFASPSGNRGVSGQVGLLLHGRVAESVTLVVCVVLVALLVWVAVRSRRTDLVLALATVVALLISPHVLIHDLALTAVPVAVALRYRAGHERAVVLLLAAVYLLFLAGFIVALFAPVQLTVLALLLLLVWLTYLSPSWTEIPARTVPLAPRSALAEQ